VSGRDNDGEAPIAALLASPAATPLGHSRATTSKLLYVKIGRAFGQQLSDIANLTNGRFAPGAVESSAETLVAAKKLRRSQPL
jgi:hypothetical protein